MISDKTKPREMVYRNRNEYQRKLMARRRAEGRDIKDEFANGFDANGCPLPTDAGRRTNCATDLLLFCVTYLPGVFYKPFSQGQIDDVQLMQETITSGGQFAFAAPRGDGKTSRVKAAAMWAMLYGYSPFVVLIGAEQGAANELLDAIKLWLRTNDELREDFPEVCIPARLTEDKPQKARSMMLDGRDLMFRWRAGEIVLPSIPGSPSSGFVAKPFGLTGRIRGVSHETPAGKTIRPSLFLIDDIQTDESARSPQQCKARLKLIRGAIMGAAGHGKKAAALAPMTIIEKDDAADQILDRKKCPEWHGRSRSMIKVWPDEQEGMWQKYKEILQECWRNDEPPDKATEYYKANQAAMDKGAVVDWILDPDAAELTSLQYAENLLFERGKVAFFAEYQNDPQDILQSEYRLSAEFIQSRTNGLPRLHCPDGANVVTIGADINRAGIHYAVIAWTRLLAGYIIDYGKYPNAMGEELWDDNDDPKTAIRAGMIKLCNRFAEMPITGAANKITAASFDCGHEMKTVLKTCIELDKQLPFRVVGARGWGDDQYRQTKTIGNPGDMCHLSEFRNVPGSKVVSSSSGVWHKRMQEAFCREPGEPGSLSLCKPGSGTHGYLADHISAEVLIDILKGNRYTVYKYQTIPGRHNDLADGVVYAMCMANLMGADPSNSVQIQGAVERAEQAAPPQNKKPPQPLRQVVRL